jgi:hypothetical protein
MLFVVKYSNGNQVILNTNDLPAIYLTMNTMNYDELG